MAKPNNKSTKGNGSAYLGFEAKLWLTVATVTRESANLTEAKPDRRSVSETELHPPFNDSDLFCKGDVPPKGNANFACVQHLRRCQTRLPRPRKQTLFIDAWKLGTLIKANCFPTFSGSN